MIQSNKPGVGAVIVALAVLWQGIGTAIVGAQVDPELSTFTTFSAFLIAAIISTVVYLAFYRRKYRATETPHPPHENDNCSKPQSVYCGRFLLILCFHYFDAAHCSKCHRNRSRPFYCRSNNDLVGQKAQQFIGVHNCSSGSGSMFFLPRNGKQFTPVLSGFRSSCRRRNFCGRSALLLALGY